MPQLCTRISVTVRGRESKWTRSIRQDRTFGGLLDAILGNWGVNGVIAFGAGLLRRGRVWKRNFVSPHATYPLSRAGCPGKVLGLTSCCSRVLDCVGHFEGSDCQRSRCVVPASVGLYSGV